MPKIRFLRNTLYKGNAYEVGQVIEVKEDDADAKYLVAIGKAANVKTVEKAVVTPPEDEANPIVKGVDGMKALGRKHTPAKPK